MLPVLVLGAPLSLKRVTITAMNEPQPAFYSILPANVRYDPDLTDSEKVMYSEITALCNKDGFCWCTNGYFAHLYGVSESTISRRINALAKKGYIHHSVSTFDGNRRCVSILQKVDTKCYSSQIRVDPSSDLTRPLSLSSSSTQKEKKENTNTVFTPESLSPKDLLCRWLVEQWNSSASETGAPRVLKLSPDRTKRLRVCVESHPDKGFWIGVFERIAKTPCLHDRKKTPWFSFDFLFRGSEQAEKVLSGWMDWSNGDKVEELEYDGGEVSPECEEAAGVLYRACIDTEKVGLPSGDRSSYMAAASRVVQWKKALNVQLHMSSAEVLKELARFVSMTCKWRDRIRPKDIAPGGPVFSDFLAKLRANGKDVPNA